MPHKLLSYRKKSVPQKVSDYRPISLTTSIYKIIAKVLAERLKLVLPQTISQNQLAFVKSRQIIDPILLLTKLLTGGGVAKDKALSLNQTLKKPSNKLNWNFLLSILKQKGFPNKWITWIYGCISTESYSILINGNSRGFIQATRGIRQGDPFSPFLFVIAIHYLSSLF